MASSIQQEAGSMRTEPRKIPRSSISWPKAKKVVRKWLNMKTRADEFDSDYSARVSDYPESRRKSCSDKDCYVVVPDSFSDEWLKKSTNGSKSSRFESEALPANNAVNFRMFAGTWNVGGKSPHEGLNLKGWLTSHAPADIYVIGFQEIVPLNAGNVLGVEDDGPAAMWLSLIRQALNSGCNDHEVANSYDNSEIDMVQLSLQSEGNIKPRISFSEWMSLEDELDGEDFGKLSNTYSNLSSTGEVFPVSHFMSGRQCSQKQNKNYYLAASKQMVGILLCVWVRSDLYKHISNLKVSCVGRGVMGYLGNKGSISISMTLYNNTFCFVCTHLTSGERDGDEVRRNFDVMEILKKTKFSQSWKPMAHAVQPESILEHDKIIWLGDLNYRLAASFGGTQELLKKNDWQALLELDQLRIEQRAGRVFEGWNEGRIYFAPTYKYLENSDHYVVQISKSKEKRRIPAWCDRILWKGDGLKQMLYLRGESKFSDHRPVYSLFSVQIDMTREKPKLAGSTSTTSSVAFWSCNSKQCAALSSACVAKIQAEELLLPTRTQRCSDTRRRF